MITHFEQYSIYEDYVIERFNRDPIWDFLRASSNEVFTQLLLQLGHLSMAFVPWYERAKLGMEDEAAKEVIRAIMRDEIPRDLPTHQDDRLDDLMRMGIPKGLVLLTPPSPQTEETLMTLQALIEYYPEDYDLRTLITLRIAGEVLVAETYRHVVPELTRRFGLKPEDSKFYYPHFKHDEKAGEGHTKSFDAVITKCLRSDGVPGAVASQAAERAFEARLKFYHQFRPQAAAYTGGRRLLCG